jgi:hypothetical protein
MAEYRLIFLDGGGMPNELSERVRAAKHSIYGSVGNIGVRDKSWASR